MHVSFIIRFFNMYLFEGRYLPPLGHKSNRHVLLINYNIWRESHINLNWFSWGSSFLVELEFVNVAFCGGRKITAVILIRFNGLRV